MRSFRMVHRAVLGAKGAGRGIWRMSCGGYADIFLRHMFLLKHSRGSRTSGIGFGKRFEGKKSEFAGLRAMKPGGIGKVFWFRGNWIRVELRSAETMSHVLSNRNSWTGDIRQWTPKRGDGTLS